MTDRIIPTPKPGDMLWLLDKAEEVVVPVLVVEVPKIRKFHNKSSCHDRYVVLYKDKLINVLNYESGLILFHDKQEADDELAYYVEWFDSFGHM